MAIIQFPVPRAAVEAVEEITQEELRNFLQLSELIAELEALKRAEASGLRARLLAGAGVEPGAAASVLINLFGGGSNVCSLIEGNNDFR